MKRNLAFLLLLLLFNIQSAKSQNLTIDELISLRKKDVATFEEYVTNKGWIYTSGNSPTEESMGKAMFTYNKSNYDNRAQSFLNYIYSDTGRIRLDIQIIKVEIYNSFIARLKNLGCKVIKSKIEDGNIVKVYQGKTTTIEVTISTPESDANISKTHYTFFIIENDDYFKNFSE